jgi:quinol monooxygenase YgiN
MNITPTCYLLEGAFRIVSPNHDHAIQVLKSVQDGARAAAGCQVYQFSVAIDDPSVVRLFEVWSTEADVRRHLARVDPALVEQVRQTVEPIGHMTFYRAPSGEPFEFAAED